MPIIKRAILLARRASAAIFDLCFFDDDCEGALHLSCEAAWCIAANSYLFCFGAPLFCCLKSTKLPKTESNRKAFVSVGIFHANFTEVYWETSDEKFPTNKNSKRLQTFWDRIEIYSKVKVSSCNLHKKAVLDTLKLFKLWNTHWSTYTVAKLHNFVAK